MNILVVLVARSEGKIITTKPQTIYKRQTTYVRLIITPQTFALTQSTKMNKQGVKTTNVLNLHRTSMMIWINVYVTSLSYINIC
jgi:hypothetical protein